MQIRDWQAASGICRYGIGAADFRYFVFIIHILYIVFCFIEHILIIIVLNIEQYRRIIVSGETMK